MSGAVASLVRSGGSRGRFGWPGSSCPISLAQASVSRVHLFKRGREANHASSPQPLVLSLVVPEVQSALGVKGSPDAVHGSSDRIVQLHGCRGAGSEVADTQLLRTRVASNQAAQTVGPVA